MNVFVDAGPFRAFVSPRDQSRKKTLNILTKLAKDNVHLITTDYVIDEVFTGLVAHIKGGYPYIQKFEKEILQSNILTIEWIGKERFYQTKKFFLKVSKDKQWSFTDCTSYVVMKELKVKTVFTFDDHFQEMGFTLL